MLDVRAKLTATKMLKWVNAGTMLNRSAAAAAGSVGRIQAIVLKNNR